MLCYGSSSRVLCADGFGRVLCAGSRGRVICYGSSCCRALSLGSSSSRVPCYVSNSWVVRHGSCRVPCYGCSVAGGGGLQGNRKQSFLNVRRTGGVAVEANSCPSLIRCMRGCCQCQAGGGGAG